jgi:DNA-directed RNA polymerase subunit M/transcription elongation factor TFIIS
MIRKCIECGGRLEKVSVKREGVSLEAWKCSKCGEEYYSSEQVTKYEIMTGKMKKYVRKARIIGMSIVVTIPKELTEKYDIDQGELLYFEPKKDGLLLKPIETVKR